MAENAMPHRRRPFKDISGQTFGRLTPRERVRPESRYIYWRCDCVCGGEKEVSINNLSNGSIRSCGCLSREARWGARKHGDARSTKKTPEYRAWSGIKERCYNQSNKGFVNYGSRGITVCPEWIDDFPAFLRDMGRRPSPKHSIDRRDNDLGYFKDNCRWATRSQQSRNRRNMPCISWRGRKMPVADWADEVGISPGTLNRRLHQGWGAEKALFTPVGAGGKPRSGHRAAA